MRSGTGQPLPTGVRTVETAWISMADGRRLAARLFLPATNDPAPVILEYIPYRRRDGTRLGDDRTMLWFAEQGYACARVDIAGTGDSDGLIGDEYVAREQDDACEIIAWLAAQPWSTGAIGMIGHSWGGFSSLQAAARQPPALKAVVSMYSTDDRFACDAHYMGGCLIDSNFAWGSAFFSFCALPPDPAVVGGDRWRDMWRQRIDNLVLPPATWLRHQRRDDFWKHGSVCEDFSAITCPVLAVGGWLDGYTRTVFNLVENMTAPCKGLIGPWGHKTPEIGFPGPAIGFLQECLRWWDHWLKGIDTGVGFDPAMRLYVMDALAPDPIAAHRPGRWIALYDWPGNAPPTQEFALRGDGSLDRGSVMSGRAPMTICSPLTVGQTAQDWCPYGQGRVAPDGSIDQRFDDVFSLCFDHAPLVEPLTILGTGWARLRLSADRPVAQVAARVTDVAPDGTSTFVTFGVLNLTHRNGSEAPEALEPGKFYDVAVELKPVAQVIPAGHRLRLAISSAFWPMLWPAPEVVTLQIDPAASRLSLPYMPDDWQAASVSFEPPAMAEIGATTTLVPGDQKRMRTLDVATGEMTLCVSSDDGVYRIDEIGTEVSSSHEKVQTTRPDDPSSARFWSEYKSGFSRADWNARLQTNLTITCDKSNFYVAGELVAHDGDDEFARRLFSETISRDLG
ncbi:MAG: CocE/NonD family hydrolase [Paracoccaceae bacterium]